MAFWNDPSALTPKQSHRWVISFGAYDDSLILQGATLQTIIDSKIPYYFAKSVDRPSYEIGSQQVKYLYSHTLNFPKRVTWKPVSVTFYDVKISEYINNTDLLKNSNDSETIFISPKISGKEIVEDNSFVTGSYNTTGGLSFQKSTQLFFYSFLQKAGYYNPEELQKDDQLLRFRKYNFKKDMINALVQNNKIPNQDFGNDQIASDTEKFHTITILELDESGLILEASKLYNPLINDVKFDRLDYSSENILTITATINYDWAKLVPYVGAIKTNNTNQVNKQQNNNTNNQNNNINNNQNNNSIDVSRLSPAKRARLSGGLPALGADLSVEETGWRQPNEFGVSGIKTSSQETTFVQTPPERAERSFLETLKEENKDIQKNMDKALSSVVK